MHDELTSSYKTVLEVKLMTTYDYFLALFSLNLALFSLNSTTQCIHDINFVSS